MRDFFQRQEKARGRTTLFMGLFVLAVLVVILGVYSAASATVFLLKAFNRPETIVKFVYWDTILFFQTTMATALVIIIASMNKVRSLKGGGGSVALMLGGRLVQPNTRDAAEKRLLNVVEEMAIASGVPVPDVYVMGHETGINAFAAGVGLGDSIICVTKGALMLLSRDELQGVVAHEFSHIFNGDTALNLQLMGMLHGILVISLLGKKMISVLRHTAGRSIWVMFVGGSALYIIGSIGLFCGNLIKAAVSRQREYLADASAVQFTRNPSGLSGALKKIGGLGSGSKLWHPSAPEASHMYFGDGQAASLFPMLSTHPPLDERITRLEPRFDGNYPRVKPLETEKPPKPIRIVPSRDMKAAAMTGAVAMAILDNMGAPMKEHLEEAGDIIGGLPEAVREAAREPYSARALIYTLLVDHDEGVRLRQMDTLVREETVGVVHETGTLLESLPLVDGRARLVLMDMVMPALRTLSREQYISFRETVRALAGADGKLSLLEYVLKHVILHRLDEHFNKRPKKPAQIYSLNGVRRECVLVLSMLARVGERDEEKASLAFMHAARVLWGKGVKADLLERGQCNTGQLDRALERLGLASMLVKKKLIAACIECVAYDKAITAEEGELLRVLTGAMGCPAPIWLVGKEAA